MNQGTRSDQGYKKEIFEHLQKVNGDVDADMAQEYINKARENTGRYFKNNIVERLEKATAGHAPSWEEKGNMLDRWAEQKKRALEKRQQQVANKRDKWT